MAAATHTGQGGARTELFSGRRRHLRAPRLQRVLAGFLRAARHPLARGLPFFCSGPCLAADPSQ